MNGTTDTATDVAATGLVYSARELDALELASPRLLVAEPLPVPAGARVIFHGKGGSWKTWVALLVAVSVAAAGGKSFVLLGEGALVHLRDRLRRLSAAAGVALGDLGDRLRVLAGGFDAADPDDERARAVAASLQADPPDIVVCDPLAAYFRGDENSASDVGSFLRVLDALPEAGIAVLLVHHDRKATGADADMRGSSALRGWADQIYGFDADASEAGLVRITNTKSRDGVTVAPFALTLTVDDAVNWSRKVTQEAAPEQRVVSSARDLIATDGPMTAADLKRALRVSGALMGKVVAALKEATDVTTTKVTRADARGRSRSFDAFALTTGAATPHAITSPPTSGRRDKPLKGVPPSRR